MIRACLVTLLISLLGLLTAACSSIGANTGAGVEPVSVDPGSVLKAFDVSRPMDVETAQVARKAAGLARDETDDALLRERIACYRRFLVTRCLADVMSRQLLVDSRINAVEVAANQSLRESAALELNQRTARTLEERAAASATEAAKALDNLKSFEARIEAAEKARLERERDAPELERQAKAARADRERREKENAIRRAEAATRAAEDSVFVAERERRLEENPERPANGPCVISACLKKRVEESSRQHRHAPSEQGPLHDSAVFQIACDVSMPQPKGQCALNAVISQPIVEGLV